MILGKEAAPDETVKAAGKKGLRHLGGLATEERLDMGVIEEAFVGVADTGDGFKKNPRIHIEKAAYLVQHIGAREALAGEVAVELGAVDPELATKRGDRAVFLAEVAQVLTEHGAQFGRVRGGRGLGFDVTGHLAHAPWNGRIRSVANQR